VTGRTALRVPLVMLALVAVAWGAVSVATTLAGATRVIDGRHADIRTVEVHAGMGVVRVAGREAATDVVLRQRQRWHLRTPRFAAVREGDRLVVRSSCPWNVGRPCDGALDLTVPPGTALEIRSEDGAVGLRGLSGSVTVRSGDGPISATALRAADVDLVAGDARVDVAFITAPGRIRAAAADGAVDIRVPRDGRPWRVDGRTGDAPREVGIAVDPTAPRTITVDTADGPVRIAHGD